ncbi:MAG TPA: hypothetical protein VGS41_01765 [Chthonomonadales bacterium]|nr:hypothetical protein [Chthonomonadales bacterium]
MDWDSHWEEDLYTLSELAVKYTFPLARLEAACAPRPGNHRVIDDVVQFRFTYLIKKYRMLREAEEDAARRLVRCERLGTCELCHREAVLRLSHIVLADHSGGEISPSVGFVPVNAEPHRAMELLRRA